LPLRRLSRAQYENALHDLLGEVLGAGPGDQAFAQLSSSLAKVPQDIRQGDPQEKHGGYRRLDQAVQQELVEGTFQVASDVGALLSAPGALPSLLGPCASGPASGSQACVDQFIQSFGARVHRRPLDADDLAFYRDVYAASGIDPAGIADIIGTMLSSPYFLYQVEHGAGAGSGPGVFKLSGFELASRLSFHLWQSAPDAKLLDAAASGSLETDAGYAAQVTRMSADPRVRRSLDAFFTEWLWLDDVPEMDSLVATPVFDAFRGDFTPGPDLREHMIDEIVSMAAHYTLDAGGTFEDLLTSKLSFARQDDLAKLYGEAPWDGKSQPQAFHDASRVGLPSRAAFLATGTANTRPIMKGVFLRKGLLCDKVPPPPNNANAMPPKLAADLTTREVVEHLTQQDGTVCSGCHTTLINPLGFSTESFDSLGRGRTMQTLFDDTGKVVGHKPVDTRTVPHVASGDARPSAGPADLVQYLVESQKPQACFIRNYFRFTFGRMEDLTRDGCTLESVRSTLAAGKPLRDVLAGMAIARPFRERRFDGATGGQP
jgi:hypothetical protein